MTDQVEFEFIATHEPTGEEIFITVSVADNGEEYQELDDAAWELALPQAATLLDCDESDVTLSPA